MHGWALPVMATVALAALCGASAPVQLLCDYRAPALGVDLSRPVRFSWAMSPESAEDMVGARARARTQRRKKEIKQMKTKKGKERKKEKKKK